VDSFFKWLQKKLLSFIIQQLIIIITHEHEHYYRISRDEGSGRCNPSNRGAAAR
jgi:hypothetical protein